MVTLSLPRIHKCVTTLQNSRTSEYAMNYKALLPSVLALAIGCGKAELPTVTATPPEPQQQTVQTEARPARDVQGLVEHATRLEHQLANLQTEFQHLPAYNPSHVAGLAHEYQRVHDTYVRAQRTCASQHAPFQGQNYPPLNETDEELLIATALARQLNSLVPVFAHIHRLPAHQAMTLALDYDSLHRDYQRRAERLRSRGIPLTVAPLPLPPRMQALQQTLAVRAPGQFHHADGQFEYGIQPDPDRTTRQSRQESFHYEEHPSVNNYSRLILIGSPDALAKYTIDYEETEYSTSDNAPLLHGMISKHEQYYPTTEEWAEIIANIRECAYTRPRVTLDFLDEYFDTMYTTGERDSMDALVHRLCLPHVSAQFPLTQLDTHVDITITDRTLVLTYPHWQRTLRFEQESLRGHITDTLTVDERIASVREWYTRTSVQTFYDQARADVEQFSMALNAQAEIRRLQNTVRTVHELPPRLDMICPLDTLANEPLVEQWKIIQQATRYFQDSKQESYCERQIGELTGTPPGPPWNPW